MNGEKQRKGRVLPVLVGLVALSAFGCKDVHPSPLSLPPTTETPAREIVVIPRTPFLATYPCAERCHGADAGVEQPPRFHSLTELSHGPVLTDCTKCHDENDMNQLHRLDGTPVAFDESQRICAQCHNARYDNWVQGIHGIATRGPDGRSQRRACTGCHDPHQPGEITLEALPPPPGGNHAGGSHD